MCAQDIAANDNLHEAVNNGLHSVIFWKTIPVRESKSCSGQNMRFNIYATRNQTINLRDEQGTVGIVSVHVESPIRLQDASDIIRILLIIKLAAGKDSEDRRMVNTTATVATMR